MQPEKNIPEKRQLTQKQLKMLRLILQSLHIDNYKIYYSLSKKDSNTGWFSNERLLLLHQKQASLRYYSKLPKGLPFTHEKQIVQGKQKIFLKSLNKFRCHPVQQKISTFAVIWDDNGTQRMWTFVMGSSKLMTDWVQLINRTRQAPNRLSEIKQVKQQIEHMNNKLYQPSQHNKSPNKNNSNIIQTQPINKQNKIEYLPNNNKQTSQINKNINNSNINNTGQLPQGLQSNRQPSQPFYDFVGEIKYLRNDHESRFNLTNQMETDRNNKNNQIDEEKKRLLLLKQLQQQQKRRKIQQEQLERQRQYRKKLQEEKNNQQQYLRRQRQRKYKQTMNIQPQVSKLKQQQQETKRRLIQLERQRQLQQRKLERIRIQEDKLRTQRDVSQAHGNGNLNSSRLQNYKNTNPNNKNFHNFDSNESNQNNYNSKKQNYNSSRNLDLQDGKNKKMQRIYSQNDPQLTVTGNNRLFTQISKNYSRNIKKNPPRKWNIQWCQKQNTLEVHQAFANASRNCMKQIVDQLPFLKRDRYFTSIEENPPYHIYKEEGIIFVLHQYSKNQKNQSDNYNDQAPLIYDQMTYQQIKREFQNYKLILTITDNKGYIRVPLSCLIQYKGILAFCKAQMPTDFYPLPPHKIQQQLQVLEKLIKCKFIASQYNVFCHPASKYCLVNDLANMIPIVPNNKQPFGYFDSNFLINYEDILEDKESILNAHYNILKVNISQFLQRHQSLEQWVVDTNDLSKHLSSYGLSYCYIPQIYKQSTCLHLKRVLSTQLVAQIFTNIIRSQMNHTFTIFPIHDFDKINTQIINNILLDGIHVLINELFSYSLRSQNIWKVIVNEINKKYHIIVSKEDLIPGYLLSAIINKNGLQCQCKKSNLNRQNEFFIKQNTIPRNLFLNFKQVVTQYPINHIDPIYSEVYQLINSELDPNNFERIIYLLDLKNQPLQKNSLFQQISLYLCNFIPFDDHSQYQHLNIYDQILKQPHTEVSLKISLLAIKWCIKKKNIEVANDIFEDKCFQNCFWLGEFNPPIGQFYDFFSLYYEKIGNHQQSIKLAKSSLINAIKILGMNALPTADKHYQLGNIFFKISRKQQALKQYLKTKQILSMHQQTVIPEYGMILLKMSLLFLNFGKIKDCVINSLDAIKIFDKNGGNEQNQIEIFQILTRAYQITRKSNDMVSVGALCSQKFNSTQNPKIFEKMMKIVLFPKLSTLNSHESKSLQSLLFKLQEVDSPITYIESFNFLHRKSYNIVIMKKLLSFIDNINSLYQDILRRDIFRKYKSLNFDTKSQAEQLLVILQAVCAMIGYGFLLGSLKQSYYD